MSGRFLFFSGKGGVGKTSMATVAAIRSAEEGKRTLIVTTDPASNLSDVFEQPIGHRITAIDGVPGLWAMEIDPDRATEEYIDHAMAPIRAAFPPQMVQVMEEQMSGPCTSEVAAFDRFTDFLEAPSGSGQTFDRIIFDTAPTGHTIRLLELPSEWTQSIDSASEGSGQTCIGPAAAIQDAKAKYERALRTLRDADHTSFVFVLHPESIAIRETRRAIDELKRLGIDNHRLIVNGIIPDAAEKDRLFAERADLQARYLKEIEAEFRYPSERMSLLAGEIRGVERLREVARIFFDGAPVETEGDVVLASGIPTATDLEEVRPRLVPDGNRRTVFFAGKGGVGKTVASCLTAVWLSRQGYRTLLLTTDPAAHLGDVLGVPVGDEAAPVEGAPSLWAAKIDPKATADAYKARILGDARERGRPDSAIRVMAEELESPCTEEIAAFDKFIEHASQGDWEVVVFDTAPTGHTLRLLELPVEWSKQLDVKVFASVDTAAADDVAKQHFGEVIEMMRDPAQSTFAFVMYPESTPILEAHRMAEELRGLGIEPGLIVANMVIPAEQVTTPFARARRAMQERYLEEMRERFQVPVLEIPLLPYEVSGLDLLDRLGRQMLGETVRA
ncbi:MAG TPA: TRC40/GET3/ArsA family transport-energizing ATPase [Actinomycetota bacterium]|nr:TRC40/GET3/ArsA family transport-energizing ATPase [Actinomycetota bacterium]